MIMLFSDLLLFQFMSRIGHGKLLGPKGITVDGNGLLYVVDNKASSILIFQQNGKLLHKFGSRGNDEGQFAGPHFVAVNSKGNIIVTDFHNHCVKVGGKWEEIPQEFLWR